jgi:hypothetical protein
MHSDSQCNEECAICYNKLDEGSAYKLECGHCFHTQCAITWFRSGHETCPLCRGFPQIKIKPVDVMHRARSIMDDFFLGNTQGYSQPIDPVLQRKLQHCKSLETSMNIERGELNKIQLHFKTVENKQKQDILKTYRELREEFKRKTDPLLKRLDDIDTTHRRKRKVIQRSIASMRREKRCLMRDIGLSGLSENSVL